MFTTLLWAVGLLLLTGLAAQLFDVLADNVAATAASHIEEGFIRSTFASRNRYLFLQSAVQRVGQALVLAYGGTRVLAHQLTPGDVVMFVTYLDKLYDPIDSLTTLAKTLQEHAMSVRRALTLRDVPDVEPAGEPLLAGPGRIEVRGLRFGSSCPHPSRREAGPRPEWPAPRGTLQ